MSEGNGNPAALLDQRAEWEAKIKQHGEETIVAEMRRFALSTVCSDLAALIDQGERDVEDSRRMRELVGTLIELSEAIPQEAESG